jgi:lipid kinase YegS
MRKLRLVLNGKAAGDEAVRIAVDAFRAAGNELEVRATWEAGHAAHFAREAAEQGFDAVIAGGGDGTINEVVQGLLAAGGPTALAVLPHGTANDFARLVGVPVDDPLAALHLAATAAPTPIDVGLVNDRPFVNVASGGFGAAVTARTSPELKEAWGGAAYSITALLSAAELRPYACRVVIGERSYELPVTMLAVGNGRFAGGGFAVAPQARCDDGLLDLVLVPSVPFGDLPQLVGELFDVAAAENQHILYRQLAQFELQFAEDFQVNLDGEPVVGRTFRFSVLPQRLQLIAPQQAENAGETTETSENASWL